MSGLLQDDILNEMRIEMSWLMDAVIALANEMNLSSYTLCLLRHRVEPEEARAIERVIFENYKDIDHLSFEILRSRVVQDFSDTTQKPWSLTDELLRELVALKLSELRNP